MTGSGDGPDRSAAGHPDTAPGLPDANLRLPNADPVFPDANLRIPGGDSGLPAGGAGLRLPGAPGADVAPDEDRLLRSGLFDSYRRDIGRGWGRTSGARHAPGSPPPAPGNGVPALPITSGKDRPS
ncbi:hypothetical protein [Streptomyces sp. NRRL S-118]|uniref:hypothetical protein n=1 Tax=Streptomyces sp. NRRL S-118 TaxID=1463881 RepID=UPI0004C6F1C9|nr:hypothetical protein [Streptomyces sp. NRRL S-118]